VKFTPTEGGEITGMLSVSDNAVGSPQEVTLTGTGQDFTIGPYNLAHTMPAGFTAAYDLQVAPAGGFNQTVALACSGAPQQSSCSVTPASTTLDGRTHAVITLRVTTAAPAVQAPGNKMPPAGKGWPQGLPLGWLLALSGLLLLLTTAVAARNRALRSRPAESDACRNAMLRTGLAAPLATLLLLTLLWGACGGGGSSFVAPQPTGGTPSGTYVITVTATSGQLTHGLTVKLTVH
jgi:hypothetical protein